MVQTPFPSSAPRAHPAAGLPSRGRGCVPGAGAGVPSRRAAPAPAGRERSGAGRAAAAQQSPARGPPVFRAGAGGAGRAGGTAGTAGERGAAGAMPGRWRRGGIQSPLGPAGGCPRALVQVGSGGPGGGERGRKREGAQEREGAPGASPPAPRPPRPGRARRLQGRSGRRPRDPPREVGEGAGGQGMEAGAAAESPRLGGWRLMARVELCGRCCPPEHRGRRFQRLSCKFDWKGGEALVSQAISRFRWILQVSSPRCRVMLGERTALKV